MAESLQYGPKFGLKIAWTNYVKSVIIKCEFKEVATSMSVTGVDDNLTSQIRKNPVPFCVCFLIVLISFLISSSSIIININPNKIKTFVAIHCSLHLPFRIRTVGDDLDGFTN